MFRWVNDFDIRIGSSVTSRLFETERRSEVKGSYWCNCWTTSNVHCVGWEAEEAPGET